jgi:hypothetical protein
VNVKSAEAKKVWLPWFLYSWHSGDLTLQHSIQTPAILVDTDFSSFKENCQLLPKYCPFWQNFRTQVVHLQKTQLMAFFRKIQSPHLIIYEFLNVMIKNTSHDTITDSSSETFLHKNGSFLLETSDIHKEGLFFLLWFKYKKNFLWRTGLEIFVC